MGGSQPTGPVKTVWVCQVWYLGTCFSKNLGGCIFLFGVLLFFSDLGGGSKVKMMRLLYSNGNLGFIRIPCYPKKGMRISIIMSQNVTFVHLLM